jgi:Tol biopolymer transport system component
VMDADGTNDTRISANISEHDDYEIDEIVRTISQNPVWSPDSKKIAFTSYTVADTGASSSAEPASAPAAGINGIYVANANGTGLCRIHWIPSSDTLGGPDSFLTWSPTGEKMAYYDGSDIVVIKADATGKADSTGPWDLIKTIGNAQPPHSWSPDGERIAIVQLGDLYVINAASGGKRHLTHTAAPEAFPAWSPDGKKIAFFSGAAARSDSASPSASADTAGESADLYVINADGSGLRRLANATVSKAFPTWSPDGEEIAFFCPAAPGLKGTDLCMIKADGTEWKRLARDIGGTLD